MAPVKIALTFLISFAFAETIAWTIDLPEYRKYLFEKSEKDELKRGSLKEEKKKELFFDNIQPDSPHNEEELDYLHENYHETGQDSENDVYGGQYAEGYEYMSYMEKKVHGIVHNGSVYLEGLRRALEDYGELLTNCSRRFNSTQPRSTNGPWLSENERPFPGNFNQSEFILPPFNSLEQPTNQAQNLFNNVQNISNSQGPSLPLNRGFNGSVDRETCERASRASEHVRRLAQLALWATRELQDRAYGDKYDKDPSHRSDDEEEAESELLLRLAFFLDRLATLTGYEPTPADYTTQAPTTTTSTALPSASPLGDVPPEVRDRMMTCLQGGGASAAGGGSGTGSEPAPDRCRYPLRHPDFIRTLFDVTDSPDIVQPIATEPAPPKDPSTREVFRNPMGFSTRQKRDLTNSLTAEDVDNLTVRHTQYGDEDRKKREILTSDTDNHLLDKNEEAKYYYKQNVYKNLIANLDATISPINKIFDGNSNNKPNREKRSLDDNPLEKVMNYYVKHKVWTNSNTQIDNADNFDVGNHLSADMTPLKTVKKRSVDVKKSQHLKLPENPFQDISNFVKHKEGINYVKNEVESEKLRNYLQKIRQSDSLTSKPYFQKNGYVKVQNRKSIQKRSIKYENKFLPSRSEDPRQDISYYVKNKPGVDYQSNLVQAAQVRAGLEQVYQTGNILVVQRYGSNYNPAIPFPLGFGVFRSFFVDI